MHATPSWSASNLECTSQHAGEVMVEAFRALGGSQPATWSAHRWRYASSDPAISIGSVWDPQTQIGICGDWLNGGRVEGAWLSGRTLAQQML